jgi:hypothetical protein
MSVSLREKPGVGHKPKEKNPHFYTKSPVTHWCSMLLKNSSAMTKGICIYSIFLPPVFLLLDKSWGEQSHGLSMPPEFFPLPSPLPLHFWYFFFFGGGGIEY